MSLLDGYMSVLGQPMALFGIVGQGLFTARFVVQWVVSEKKHESTIPVVFWYLSIAAACLVLVYAIWRRDPVFTLAQFFGLIVYFRNLALIRKSRKTRSLT